MSNPVGASDQRSTADDHLRLLKASIKRTFPNIAGEMSASHGELNLVRSLTVNVQAEFTRIRTNPASNGTVAYALAANSAVSASYAQSASFAVNAGFAQSASFAANAGFAQSASFAAHAAEAASASFAQSASFASKANIAQSASDALALGGVVASRYIDRAAPGSISGTVHFAVNPVKVGAGGYLSMAAAGNISGGAVTVTSTTPAVVFGSPGDIQLVCGPL